LLPGSRRSEIDQLAVRFVQAAQRMLTQKPDLQFVLPAVPALLAHVQAAVERAGGLKNLVLLKGQSHQALTACDVTLIASGTATLEAALFKRPMVIGYHMNALSWLIMRGKKLQPWVGLPNILAEEFLVPELLQEACTPERLAHETLAWLGNPARIAQVQQQFEALHHTLIRPTAQLATHAIEKVLGR
jgi:lipid-A-disaccharide synthase